MRLVDADALIKDMEMHVTTMSVCSTTIEARAKGEMKRTCIADVANAPTIDAIPVEWIISWSNKRYRETQKDVSIVDVLEAWQKEQEVQDSD